MFPLQVLNYCLELKLIHIIGNNCLRTIFLSESLFFFLIKSPSIRTPIAGAISHKNQPSLLPFVSLSLPEFDLLAVCWPMQSASWSSENFLHSKLFGQANPNFFIRPSQRRADSHNDRHGGKGRSSGVQTGTYIAHKKS